MKSVYQVIFALCISLQVNAGIGGSGGGTEGYYTAEICQTTESGQPMGCRMVRFKQKNKSSENSQDPNNCSAEIENTICDRPRAHVPALLNKINKWFLDRGFQSPAQNDDWHNN